MAVVRACEVDPPERIAGGSVRRARPPPEIDEPSPTGQARPPSTTCPTRRSTSRSAPDAGSMKRPRAARRVGCTVTVLVLCVAPGAGATAAPAAAPPATRWFWPLDPAPRVLATFRAPVGPYGPGHRGVDLAGRVGQPVRAAGPGTIAFVGAVAGRGVVTVEHRGGRRTTYEPVAAVVETGDHVDAGTRLGTLGAAPGHCLPGTCLHWGLRQGDVYLDPLTLLSMVRVRLLPIWTDIAALWRGQVRAGRAGPRRAAGSRQGRCRPGRRDGRSRAPPTW